MRSASPSDLNTSVQLSTGEHTISCLKPAQPKPKSAQKNPSFSMFWSQWAQHTDLWLIYALTGQAYKDNQFTSRRNLASNTAWLANLSLHVVGFLIQFSKHIKKDHYITVWMRWWSDKSYCYLWHRQQQYDRHLKKNTLHYVQVKNIPMYNVPDVVNAMVTF